VEAKKQGLGSRKIAKDLGVSKTTVNYWYQRFLDEQNESAIDILNIQQPHLEVFF
jgi:transposase